jgi:hypothetical protein
VKWIKYDAEREEGIKYDENIEIIVSRYSLVGRAFAL